MQQHVASDRGLLVSGLSIDRQQDRGWIRGLASAVPEHISCEKTAECLALREIARSGDRLIPVSFHTLSGWKPSVFAAMSSSECMPRFRIPEGYELVRHLQASESRTAHVHVSIDPPVIAPSMQAFSEMLHKHNPALQEGVLASILESVQSDRRAPELADTGELVVHDKPGRFLVVVPGMVTAKIQRKQAAAMKGEMFLAQPGFSAGGLIVTKRTVTSSGSAAPQAVPDTRTLAYTEIASADGCSVETIRSWVSAIREWLSGEHGINPEKIKSLSVSAVSAPLAGFLSAQIREAGPPVEADYPDLAWGWNPFASILGVLRAPVLPAMWVGISEPHSLKMAVVY